MYWGVYFLFQTLSLVFKSITHRNISIKIKNRSFFLTFILIRLRTHMFNLLNDTALNFLKHLCIEYYIPNCVINFTKAWWRLIFAFINLNVQDPFILFSSRFTITFCCEWWSAKRTLLHTKNFLQAFQSRSWRVCIERHLLL
jgi:hypothetical protein